MKHIYKTIPLINYTSELIRKDAATLQWERAAFGDFTSKQKN